ncbi:LapA family protein [Thaumasiovibrio subtropicus]|uniref:LapA family protein n=1 Tax=Thaumasiovibrio subtropicus TaxID=1891207 RepID=UPI000B359B95|nr:lipopolysaccharide assembly protein LapA domain-containing protein [Thaumasiovibrio subtropicus]
MRIVSILLIIAFFVIALALGAQNPQEVTFNYLIAQTESIRLSVLLSIVFAVGFIPGWLICGSLYMKARFARKRLLKKLDKQQQELDKLRVAPAEASTQVVAKD